MLGCSQVDRSQVDRSQVDRRFGRVMTRDLIASLFLLAGLVLLSTHSSALAQESAGVGSAVDLPGSRTDGAVGDQDSAAAASTVEGSEVVSEGGAAKSAQAADEEAVVTILRERVGEHVDNPAWVSRIRYTEVDTATDYWLVEGGAHAKLSDCEAEFDEQLLQTAKEYVAQITGEAGAWEEVNLTVSDLRSYLVPDRELIKARENEFGVTYHKYRQLGFDESFREMVRERHRLAQQKTRLSTWAIAAGGLVGGLLLGTWLSRRGGSCCQGG